MNTHRLKTLCAVPLLAFSLSAAAITGSTSTFDFGVVGDGVQIADNWVLTAKHVGFTVTPPTSFSNGYGISGVAAVYVPGPGFLVDDLMLLRLATPLAGAPVVSLSSTVWSDSTTVNVPVTLSTNSNTAPGFPRA